MEDQIEPEQLKSQEGVSNPMSELNLNPKVSTSITYFLASDWEIYTPQTPHFCQDCQWTFPDWGRFVFRQDQNENYYRYETNLGRITAAARHGCPFCDFLSLAVENKLGKEIAEDETIWVSIERGERESWNVFFNAGEHDEWRSAMDFVPVEEKLDVENLPPLKLKGSSTKSGYSMNKAREWLSRCKHGHDKCVEEVKRKLPTRLLRFKHGKLKLVSTKDLDIKTPYAALSHCWGKIKILRLLKENFDLFHTNIPISELSHTFQDSLEVIAALGIEYIWIDSLCIIQDSASDWAREAVEMSTVYGCSEITLAASSSSDGNGGLFYNRQLPFPRLCQLQLTDTNASSKSSSDAKKIFNLTPSTPQTISLSREPLSSRAWAFQERLLSPRVLYFTSTHLSWQCATWSGEEWASENTTPSSRWFPKKSPPESEGFWDEVMMEYGGSKLTFWGDRLIAVSGVARRRWEAVGGREGGYVAGLWRGGIERGLCWRSVSRSLRPEETYMAPSWSWASTAHGVVAASRYEGIDDAVLARVINVQISLVGKDPMGQVERGVLKLECKGLFAGVFGGQTPAVVRFGNFVMRRVSILDYLESERIVSYYLPVVRDSSGGFEGLVVQPTGKARGEYRRIGCFVAAQFHMDGGKKVPVKGDVDRLAWCGLEYSEADRQLLFVSSEGNKGPHLIHVV